MRVSTSGISLTRFKFLKRISHDRTLDDLINDDYFAHAVRSAIEVIGEAAKMYPIGSKKKTSIYPGGRWQHSSNRITFSITIMIDMKNFNQGLMKKPNQSLL